MLQINSFGEFLFCVYEYLLRYGRPKLEDIQNLLQDNQSVSFLVAR